jgi:hypothetical protein
MVKSSDRKRSKCLINNRKLMTLYRAFLRCGRSHPHARITRLDGHSSLRYPEAPRLHRVRTLSDRNR